MVTSALPAKHAFGIIWNHLESFGITWDHLVVTHEKLLEDCTRTDVRGPISPHNMVLASLSPSAGGARWALKKVLASDF